MSYGYSYSDHGEREAGEFRFYFASLSLELQKRGLILPESRTKEDIEKFLEEADLKQIAEEILPGALTRQAVENNWFEDEDSRTLLERNLTDIQNRD